MSDSKRIEIVKFLAFHIKNPLEYLDDEGSTPLHLAAHIGDIQILEFFSDFSDDVHKILDIRGDSVLDEALQDLEDGYISSSRLKTVLSSIMKRDPNGATPLHYAAQKGFMKVCKLY